MYKNEENQLEDKKQDLSYFSTSEIQPASENELLYDKFSPLADEDDFKLIMSIRKDGVREPLLVSSDGVLLSGHRRLAAARWLGLTTVPCIVAGDIVFRDLTEDERIRMLAIFNKQRDKSHTEKIREAMLEVDPNEAYANLVQYRHNRRQVELEQNITLGGKKQRAKITTMAFLQAAQRVIESEEKYWPLTVRRVHYLLLNDPPLRHDKKPGSTYENVIGSYKSLTSLLLRARLTGDIPHASIEDETRPISVLRTHQHPADFIKDEVNNFLWGYSRDLLRGQPNHIEILVEKNAIRRHVELVADEYRLPCTTTRGFSSLTPRLKMVQRFRRSGKARLIVLILSDFDPDGEEIAASFPRSLRDDFGLSDVMAYKVAISGADVREHGLPSDLEAKPSSPNYRKFVALHGVHVAELDSAPVELLQGKLRDAIERCLDMDLFRVEVAKEKEDAVVIAATRKTVLDVLGRPGA